LKTPNFNFNYAVLNSLEGNFANLTNLKTSFVDSPNELLLAAL
jgi:hypothetical protein